jgi:hypothetical protein
MRSFLAAILVSSPLFAQSAADFDAQIAKFDSKSKDDRIAALKWIRGQKSTKEALDAIPKCETLANDAEPEVREAAFTTLAQICLKHKRPCPAVIAKAVRDPDDAARCLAGAFVGIFEKEQLTGCVDLLLAACADDRADVRSTCVSLIAHAAPNDARVLAAIEKARKDKVFGVRMNAECARHTAKKDLAEFLNFIVRVRAEPEAVLDKLPADSEDAKRQQCQRNLFVLGSALRIIEWSEERPDELAAALVKLLDHKSPAMRSAAADLVGASARRVDIKRADPANGFNSFKSPFESLLPNLDAERKQPKDNVEPVLPSKAYSHLVERKALSKLRYLSTMDTDETVRFRAKRALERFAEIPEPLAVRPREVKP